MKRGNGAEVPMSPWRKAEADPWLAGLRIMTTIASTATQRRAAARIKALSGAHRRGRAEYHVARDSRANEQHKIGVTP